jgi:hypothetical protein
MTIDEIFNGKDCYFPGLLPLVYAYLEFVKCDEETFVKIDQYLKFVSLLVSFLSRLTSPHLTAPLQESDRDTDDHSHLDS